MDGSLHKQGQSMAETRHDRRRDTADVPWHWNPVLLCVLWLLTFCSGALALNAPIGPVLASWAMAEPSDAKNVEYQLKAAFLYNFMKFIEWPQTAGVDGDKDSQKKNPITLCIIGNDFFGRHLDDLTKKEVKERPIRIVRLEGFESYQKTHPDATVQQYFQEQKQTIESCHLLFISQSEEKLMGDLVTFIDAMQILTVSDISDFARKGGVIEFVMEGNKIRFEVNIASADRKKLKISSQLLQLAREVHKSRQ
jgi:hypothetical protein